jgi:hypothetical protein
MSKKHGFDDDTRKESFITPPEGVADSKAADADNDYIEIEIEVDEAEVEEEDRRAPGPSPETD